MNKLRSRELNNLLKVTKLVSGRAGIQTLVSLIPKSVLLPIIPSSIGAVLDLDGKLRPSPLPGLPQTHRDPVPYRLSLL